MDVRHWHLLALLEAKLGEWKKARGVLEAALDIVDDVEARVHAEEMRDSGWYCDSRLSDFCIYQWE